MFDNVKHLMLFCILLFGLFLLRVGKTSADLTAQRTVKENKLTASTLSFSLQHSANFSSVSTLFNTPGYLPGGFDIKAVRILKTGQMKFKYRLETVTHSSDPGLCQALSLQVMKNWNEVYSGALNTFALDAEIPDSGVDSWIFILTFPDGQDQLKNQSCSFDFIAKTWKHDPNEGQKGLWAKKTLANVITTGRW